MDKENVNEYERKRLENIRKNQEKLKELNLLSASLLFKDLTEKEKIKKKKTYKKRNIAEVKPAFKRITRNQAKKLQTNVENKIEENEENETDSENDNQLLSADEYLTEEIRKKAIIVDGHFKGWINPALIEKYHFEKSAKEAWENNGGGKYSRNNPLGEYKEKVKTVKPKNWSSAKFVASKLFQKNPNAYFYRHLEPGLTQNFGDWDENEKDIFLKIAKKYGCGDKWGIFSSYIPRRVGYQCANYYRQVIIPEGLIIDPNYKFSKWGKAIYCGNINNNKKKKDNKKVLNNIKEITNNNKNNILEDKKNKNNSIESNGKMMLTKNKNINENNEALTCKQKYDDNKKTNNKLSNGKIIMLNDNKALYNDNIQSQSKNKETKREIIEILDEKETEKSYLLNKNKTKGNNNKLIKNMILRSETSTGYSLRKRRKVNYAV
ncbi:hypothetical protein BCR36DRAFT_413408 [Piromyces finnis]|uniref:Myb-like domain-containing protein n=1 Tax=Piromyces finnis TaxID=1754191 RepID=A0A1Y1V6D7_9FUNG|nr:hypothetical protein BCR36DRAFT_413408 [Piromyces finnis]|eukprot:ORX47882.1 hypothetical protein BCR36DRAFT_413408 [Piromyces finnis]